MRELPFIETAPILIAGFAGDGAAVSGLYVNKVPNGALPRSSGGRASHAYCTMIKAFRRFMTE